MADRRYDRFDFLGLKPFCHFGLPNEFSLREAGRSFTKPTDRQWPVADCNAQNTSHASHVLRAVFELTPFHRLVYVCMCKCVRCACVRTCLKTEKSGQCLSCRYRGRPSDQPCLFLKVSTVDWWSRYKLLGYGYVPLPTEPATPLPLPPFAVPPLRPCP